MTDPALIAARALFERVGWLYQAGDPKCTKEGVRAIRDAILAERERAARIAETSWLTGDGWAMFSAREIASLIRKGEP